LIFNHLERSLLRPFLVLQEVYQLFIITSQCFQQRDQHKKHRLSLS
jgi:hypothetical protein